MKIGAVTRCCRRDFDAPIPFPLSANLRYQLTQTVNVFRDSLQAEVTDEDERVRIVYGYVVGG
jgi:hypothetical protein